jgi:hypothetical protein
VKVEMIRPYLEKKVSELLGTESVAVDPDGDIPIRSGSSVSYLRLADGPEGAMLRVFSPLLSDVQQTPELLARLNELNAESFFVRFFWTSDHVMCSVDLVAESLDVEEIKNALDAVTFYADKLDDDLKARFGGSRMIEEDEARPASSDGAYL